MKLVKQPVIVTLVFLENEEELMDLARKEGCETPENFAREANIPISQMYGILKGEIGITKDMAIQFANGMGVSLRKLFGNVFD